MSNKHVLYKTLVVGVIILFIGLGIQPAFAVTLDTSESEVECNLCPNVSDKNLVELKSFTVRNKMIVNELSDIFKYTSKNEDELQYLIKEITSFLEIDCDKLALLIDDFYDLSDTYLRKGRLFLAMIYYLLFVISYNLFMVNCY